MGEGWFYGIPRGQQFTLYLPLSDRESSGSAPAGPAVRAETSAETKDIAGTTAETVDIAETSAETSGGSGGPGISGPASPSSGQTLSESSWG